MEKGVYFKKNHTKKGQTGDFARLSKEVNPMVRLSNQFLEDLEKLAAIYRDLPVDNIQTKEREDLNP